MRGYRAPQGPPGGRQRGPPVQGGTVPLPGTGYIPGVRLDPPPPPPSQQQRIDPDAGNGIATGRFMQRSRADRLRRIHELEGGPRRPVPVQEYDGGQRRALAPDQPQQLIAQDQLPQLRSPAVQVQSEEGPPPFLPRRPRLEADSGTQGRFKRMAVSGASADMPPSQQLSMFDPPAASMMQGTRHITLEEAGLTPVADDPRDPLGFAKRFGITPEELATLDKEVRFTRFNPTENTTDKLEHIEGRLRRENRLGARGIAQVSIVVRVSLSEFMFLAGLLQEWGQGNLDSGNRQILLWSRACLPGTHGCEIRGTSFRSDQGHLISSAIWVLLQIKSTKAQRGLS